MLQKPYGRRYLLLKTANACISLTVNGKLKLLSATSRTSKFGPDRKPQTLYMAPYNRRLPPKTQAAFFLEQKQTRWMDR